MNLHPQGEGISLLILSQVQSGHKMVGFFTHLLPSSSDLESGASRYLRGACKLGFQLKQQAAPPPSLEVGMKGLCMQHSFLQMVLSSFCCTP